MSHRDNFIKTNKEFSKPMDIFNTGFVGTVGGSAPDIPSAPNVSVEANTVTISWSHPDAHGNAIDVYNIYRNGVYLKQVASTSTTDSTGQIGILLEHLVQVTFMPLMLITLLVGVVYQQIVVLSYQQLHHQLHLHHQYQEVQVQLQCHGQHQVQTL